MHTARPVTHALPCPADSDSDAEPDMSGLQLLEQASAVLTALHASETRFPRAMSETRSAGGSCSRSARRTDMLSPPGDGAGVELVFEDGAPPSVQTQPAPATDAQSGPQAGVQPPLTCQDRDVALRQPPDVSSPAKQRSRQQGGGVSGISSGHAAQDLLVPMTGSLPVILAAAEDDMVGGSVGFPDEITVLSQSSADDDEGALKRLHSGCCTFPGADC